MIDSPLQRVLLDAAGTGLALADAAGLQLVACNRRMMEWFPHAQPGTPLVALVPEVQPERARARLARGRPYRVETVVRGGARELPVAVQISRHEDAGHLLVVEAENLSRVKEMEYMIESYSRMVEKQNRTLQREKERAEKLLLNIMPRRVYEEIQQFGITAPQRFTEASVLMLDFKGFTERAESQDAGTLVADLNDIFTAFDRIVEQFGCERIKTIGDAYMAVNLAARLEALSEPMTITLCEDMHALLRSHFIMEDRGEHEIRGARRRRLYTLIAEAVPSPDPDAGAVAALAESSVDAG